MGLITKGITLSMMAGTFYLGMQTKGCMQKKPIMDYTLKEMVEPYKEKAGQAAEGLEEFLENYGGRKNAARENYNR